MSTILEESLQENQYKVLQVLQDKLQASVVRVNSLRQLPETQPSIASLHFEEASKRKRVKYALFVKESLEKVNTQLEKWQPTFDPLFFLTARIATAAIDQQLSDKSTRSRDISILKRLRDAQKRNATPLSTPTSIFISDRHLEGNMIPITHSNQALLVSSSGKHFIVDKVLLKTPSNEDEEVRDVRNLARTLREADPEVFGLLQCQGVAKRLDANGKLKHFDFIFSTPTGLYDQPANLRSLLLVEGGPTTLDDRFRLAKSMARSVAYVHTCNFVHKSIRPDNVIVFPDSNSVIGQSFLVGFEKFRAASGRSNLAGDMLWEKNLYRHPRRQGIKPEEEYTMQHDIYSLGVCLLEIGLWSSFVVPAVDGARVGDGLAISDLLSIKDQTRKARQIKDVMAKTATQRLPGLMGKRYTEVVLQCLTCLDVENGFGNESDFQDADGIKVGVRYIEKVLGELEQISI